MRIHIPITTGAILVCGGLSVLAITHAPQDGSAALIARIEARQSPNRQGLDPYTIQELMQKFRITGLSVAVIKDSEIHWAKGYGLANVESERPVERDTMFQAASISKPVTAMAVLKAMQDGRLSIDVDVNQILKSWKVPRNESTGDQPVPLRSLLSHTSGADDGFGFPGYAPDLPRPTVPQILSGEKPSNVGAVLFARPPFTGYKYSGGGFTVVQLALMDALGKPFAEIMQTSVLDALEMKDSTYEQPLPAGREGKAAHAHSGQGRAMDANWHVYPEQAAAGLWTTPSDLARFAIEVQRALAGPKGKVLSQAMAREMITPIGVGGYAVGLGIEKRAEGWYFSHGGSNWGFRCNLVAHVRKGYGVVVMTNSDSGGAILGEIESRVAAAYGWDLLDKPIPR
ncbi:MAG TPA: serine hydrolase domain-containing protein [Vicinamibacterales bacterium]|jgi:CubicO group peptidase (beta-lactamase class C family)|nr:serine hydrolase domain-containing protein [Vicinamibacterales bacterium]